MEKILYLIIICICVVLVTNMYKTLKDKYRFNLTDSQPLELLICTLIGIILAGMVMFFLKFIFIPLLILIVIYVIAINYKR